MSTPNTMSRLAIGTKVTISGAGRLVGLVVDYVDATRYVIAFPKGTEIDFHASRLIVLKK